MQASIQPSPTYTRPSSTSNEINRDSIYIAHTNGIVTDTKTGLEWIAGPDRDTNWNEARLWVQGLTIDGGGWRMPTMDELVGLYEEGEGYRNMTPLLKTTGWGVWSGDTKGSLPAWSFDFIDCRGHWYARDRSDGGRAFAVRSRSDGSDDEKLEGKVKPKHTPSSSTSDVIKRDGVYVAYANGIVRDTKTGLQWKVGPDKSTNWNEARSWVQSLNLDGGGWRMPTMDELRTLYKKGAGSRNMTPLLRTTGYYVWSGETEGLSSAWPFCFDADSRDWRSRSYSSSGRAFAVRSQNDG